MEKEPPASRSRITFSWTFQGYDKFILQYTCSQTRITKNWRSSFQNSQFCLDIDSLKVAKSAILVTLQTILIWQVILPFGKMINTGYIWMLLDQRLFLLISTWTGNVSGFDICGSGVYPANMSEEVCFKIYWTQSQRLLQLSKSHFKNFGNKNVHLFHRTLYQHFLTTL